MLLHLPGKRLEVTFLHPQRRHFFADIDKAADTGQKLGGDRRNCRAAHSHVKYTDENQIQHNIYQTCQHQKIQRRAAVSKRTDHI